MRKLVIGVGLGLVGLATIMLGKTVVSYPDRQLPATSLPDRPAIDANGAIARFAGAIRIPTISHDDRSNFDGAAFERFHQYLADTFPAVHASASRTIIGGYSLLYTWQGSQPALKPVLFAGHMDVVPVDPITLGDWTHPPFAGAVADGQVWGRGTLDDKLTVMALLEAMESLLQQGLEPERTVYLAFGHDEEVGGQDGAAAIAEHLGERSVELEFALDEGGVVTEGMYPGIDRPVAVIGISEKGYMNTRLVVEDAGGHSSQPPEQTALGVLARAIVKVEDNPFPPTLDYLATTFDAIGHYAPFSLRAAVANRWLLGPLLTRSLLQNRSAAATLRTTIAATMASGSSKSNILPTRAEAIINYRIIPGETVASVRDRVIETIDDDRVHVEVEMATDPSPVSPTDSWGYELIATTIRGMDENILVAPYLVQGGTDAKYYAPLTTSAYRFMMVRADSESLRMIHGIDEHVATNEYLQAIAYYRHLMARVAGDERSAEG